MNRHRPGALVCALIATLLGVWLMTAPAYPARASGDAVRSPGCGVTGAATRGIQKLTAADGKGRDRTYLLQPPDDYDAGKPYRLVFTFHGSGGSARQGSGGLREAGDAAGTTIFVNPQGINFENAGIGWDDRAKGYDLPFFDHLLHDIGANYCIDTSRVFAVGFSWGGDFAVTLACMRGETLRGVVANSTDDEFSDSANFKTYQNYPCPAGRHPAIYFQHAVDSDEGYPAPNFATTSKLFRDLNSCRSGGQVLEPRSPVMACVAYGGCASEVTECFFDHKIGHRLPPNWSQDAWKFLSSF